MVEVEVRPAAMEQVRRLIVGQKAEVGVRVYAQTGGGGGCGCGSGGGHAVQFGMAFAKPRHDDQILKIDGFSIIIDPSSLQFVNGAVIDYVENLSESGFKITNPTLPVPDEAGMESGCGSCGSNASNGGGCGCGSH